MVSLLAVSWFFTNLELAGRACRSQPQQITSAKRREHIEEEVVRLAAVV